MNQEIKEIIKKYSTLVNHQLPRLIEELQGPSSLKESMTYSLQAGGKRVRPALLLATLTSFKKPVELGLDMACAIEMIHTYSLVHDDLPAMDDDDMRRGKPTNHRVFGEALAILAGDALLTYSFEIVSNMNHSEIDSQKKVRLIRELAKASGPEGMVGGQVADMEGETKSLTLDELVYVHQHKTGELLTVSIVAGAILAGANEEEIKHLRLFANELGLVFQIKDDILDIEGEEETIGKRVGRDSENNKSTYPSLLGLEGAKEKLEEHLTKAKSFLYKVDMDHTVLVALTDYIAYRDH